MTDMRSVAAGLRKGRDGIWYGLHAPEISYPANGHDVFRSVEEKSFWFEHRNRCILSVVRSHPPQGTIFDIGGGNGFVSLALSRSGFDTVLVEPGLQGCRNARARGLEGVVCATGDSAKFRPHSLPDIGLFDVLEHIEDDLAFLKSFRRLIRKGGRLYMTVPAYPALWSGADLSAGHFRRYSPNTIRRVVREAGFEDEFCTCIFRFLPIPIALFRSLPHRLGLSRKEEGSPGAAPAGRDHAIRSGILKKASTLVFLPEIRRLEAKKPMGFGGSCLIVAKSP
jgi:SAM-dependent methyltransferase